MLLATRIHDKPTSRQRKLDLMRWCSLCRALLAQWVKAVEGTPKAPQQTPQAAPLPAVTNRSASGPGAVEAATSAPPATTALPQSELAEAAQGATPSLKPE